MIWMSKEDLDFDVNRMIREEVFEDIRRELDALAEMTEEEAMSHYNTDETKEELVTALFDWWHMMYGCGEHYEDWLEAFAESNREVRWKSKIKIEVLWRGNLKRV